MQVRWNRAAKHPLAHAILEKCRQEGLQLPAVEHVETLSGLGLRADSEGHSIVLGNQELMKQSGCDIRSALPEMEAAARQGYSVIALGVDQQFCGFFVIADQLKSDTAQAIAQLKDMGITPVMVTGDHPLSAHAIARQAGIDEVIAKVLPQEKGEVVKRFQKEHKVAMVGDGINDAVALTQADVGIAIGSGSDVAVESADIILMKDSIVDVATAIRLSKAVIRNIHQNLFWAFFYNSIGIPIAAGVLYAFGWPAALAGICRCGDGLLQRLRGDQRPASSPFQSINRNENSRSNLSSYRKRLFFAKKKVAARQLSTDSRIGMKETAHGSFKR